MSQDIETDNKLTFVLTLAISGTGRDEQDLQRVRLLLNSFECFFEQADLDQFIIVSPPSDIGRIKKALGSLTSNKRFLFVDEQEICPEFENDPETLNAWPKPNKGWYRQQLIKLAVSEHIRTPFYMTLDSDVLFVRPFGTESLITNGRAALNVQTELDFKKIYREDIATKSVTVRQIRYREVERILQMTRQARHVRQWYGETPVLLNVELVRELARFIQQSHDRPWREFLLKNLPWTEYALYFSFVEGQGALEEFYQPGSANSVLRLFDSLWQPEMDYVVPRNLSNWDAPGVFNDTGEGVAVVVQSYLGYPVDELAEKIRPFINS